MIIFLMLVILVCVTSCDSKPFQYTFRQDRSCIEKVEICPFEYRGKKIKEPWVTLTGDDIDAILEDITSMDCWKLSPMDTPREYGDLLICIYYTDGEIEVIGTLNCGWVTPDGDWYVELWHFRFEDLSEVLLKYVDADVVAGIRWY